jgi:rSAM/selenodomain-associated transferase 2
VARSRPAVSVIIPVWNDVSALRSTLEWLSMEPGVFEVIVVDGGSVDGSREYAESHGGYRIVLSDRGRAKQLNAGAQVARSDVLLFLHCDTRLAGGAIARLPRLFEESEADFGAFRVRFEPRLALLDALGLLTWLARPWCCFGDQGIFVQREFFERVGCYPEIPLLEDVHWLRRAGREGRIVRSRDVAVTSSRRFVECGAVRQTLRNLWILIRDRLEHDPAELAGLYHGAPALKKNQVDTPRVVIADLPADLR